MDDVRLMGIFNRMTENVFTGKCIDEGLEDIDEDLKVFWDMCWGGGVRRAIQSSIEEEKGEENEIRGTI